MPGYDDKRYTVHDSTIAALVTAFNADKAGMIDATGSQASAIPDLSVDLVKAWLVQETGGNDATSLAAWFKDPGQVNVPGDWNSYKKDLGLAEPTTRNEGTAEGNLRAAVILLARKGFGRSGIAPSLRPDAVFDGWAKALERYNGRTVLTANGQPYSANYARRITERATGLTKGTTTPIELPAPYITVPATSAPAKVLP